MQEKTKETQIELDLKASIDLLVDKKISLICFFKPFERVNAGMRLTIELGAPFFILTLSSVEGIK